MGTTKERTTCPKPGAKSAKGADNICRGNRRRVCNARNECHTDAVKRVDLMKYGFELPANLTDAEVEDVLGQLDRLVTWAEAVQEHARQAALNGKHWDGYKLVEGRSARKYTDEKAVADAVIAAGKDPYEKKLLGIRAMTGLLGEKRFNELLGDLVVRPHGKTILVPESDKRPALNDDI